VCYRPERAAVNGRHPVEVRILADKTETLRPLHRRQMQRVARAEMVGQYGLIHYLEVSRSHLHQDQVGESAQLLQMKALRYLAPCSS
jgi:hypothetical protein